MPCHLKQHNILPIPFLSSQSVTKEDILQAWEIFDYYISMFYFSVNQLLNCK